VGLLAIADCDSIETALIAFRHDTWIHINCFYFSAMLRLDSKLDCSNTAHRSMHSSIRNKQPGVTQQGAVSAI
jgi:hypothetical protein